MLSAERGPLRAKDMFPEMDSLAKSLIVFGVALALLGAVLLMAGKIPFLGRLPGDILIRREHWGFYFPLTTSILISILLTLLFALFSRR
jgi:DUF2905 family protein